MPPVSPLSECECLPWLPCARRPLQHGVCVWGWGGEDNVALATWSQYSDGDEQVLSELYPGGHTQRTSVPAGHGSDG